MQANQPANAIDTEIKDLRIKLNAAQKQFDYIDDQDSEFQKLCRECANLRHELRLTMTARTILKKGG